MTKSSIRKLGLTRRVVASSGIAAALLAASPVAVAMADETSSAPTVASAPDEDGGGGGGAVDVGSSTAGDSGGSATESTPAANDGSPVAPGAEEPAVESAGESAGDAGTEPEVGAPAVESTVAEPAGAESSSPVEVGEPSAGDEASSPASAVDPATWPGAGAPASGVGGPESAVPQPNSSVSDTPTQPPRHRLPGGRHVLEEQLPVITRIVEGVQDFAVVETAAPVTLTAAEPAGDDAAPRGVIESIVYSLTGGSGTGGLILINQGAVAAAVLNRRSRQDGSDYFGIVGPGERLFLPKSTVAELVLGKHATDEDVETFDVSDDATVAPALARSLISVMSVVEVDPDNMFLDSGDADYVDGGGGVPESTQGSVAGDRIGSGAWYSVSEDGQDVLIHNVGDAPIAVTDTRTPDQLVVINPGDSPAVFATDSDSQLVVQGQRQDENGEPSTGGVPVIVGTVSIYHQTTGTPIISGSLPTQGQYENLAQWAALDPDNAVYTPDDPEDLSTATFGSPVGLRYGYDASTGTITLTNESVADVVVVAYDLNTAPVGEGIYVIPAGGAAQMPVDPDSPAFYLVQKPNPGGEPIVLGLLIASDGQVQSYPLAGGAIAGDDDPATASDQWWQPSDSDATQNGFWPSYGVGIQDEDVYYTVDGSTVTVHNDSDHDIAAIVYSGASGSSDPSSTEFVVIPAGTTYSATKLIGEQQLLLVQDSRLASGPRAGAPQIYGAIVQDDSDGSLVTTAYDVYPSDGVPVISGGAWRGIDPDDIYATPGDESSPGTVPGTASGVHYGYDPSADAITFTNDSDVTVGVLAYDTNANPVGDGLYVLAPGETATILSPADGPAIYLVQQPKTFDGKMVLVGAVQVSGDRATTVPAQGNRVVTDEMWAADPDNRFWTPGDTDITQVIDSAEIPRFGERGTLADAGVTYALDPTTGELTIANGGDADIAIIEYRNGEATHLTIIPAGESATYSPGAESGGHASGTYVVQSERTSGGAPTLVGVVNAYTYSSGDGIYGSAYASNGTDYPSNYAPSGYWWTSGQGPYIGGVYSSDPDGDTITVALTDQADHGTVTLGPNEDYYGSTTVDYTYAPNAGVEHAAAGGGPTTDTFTVTATDQYGATYEIPVTIYLTPKNESPVIGDDTATGGTTGSVGVVDADGDTLTYVVTSEPSAGSVDVDEDGHYTYFPTTPPNRGETLTDSFVITADDGHGGTVNVPVNITIEGVNTPPTAELVNQSGYSGDIDSSDVDDDTVTYAVSTQPQHGTVSVGADGSFTYTPNSGVEHAASGGGATTDDFVITASDGHGGTATIPVSVTIVAQNTAPTVAVVRDGDVAYGGQIVTVDADEDAMTYTVTDQPDHGTVSIDSDGTFTYTPNSGVEHAAAGGPSTDSFAVSVSDGHGGTAPVTVNITIEPQNEEPSDPGPVLGGFTGTLGSVDGDGDQLAYEVTGQPEHGTVAIDADGGYVYTPTQTLEHGDTLSDSFVVTVSDGHGGSTPVTVHVAGVGPNTAPTGTVTGDGGYTGNVVGADADLDELSYSLGSDPLHGPSHGTVTVNGDGSYTYIPSAGVEHAAAADGPAMDSFVVLVSDGHGGSTPVVVNVAITPSNQAPTGAVTGSGYTGAVVGADADNDTLTYTVTTDPTSGTVAFNPNGTFTYTPNEGVEHAAAGDGAASDSFVVRIDDGHGSSTDVTVPITITPQNNAVVAPESVSGGYAGSVAGTDADGDTLGYEVVGAPENGTVWIGPGGSYTYTPTSEPDHGETLTDSFEVEVSDGHGSTQTVTVNVSAVGPNTAPTIDTSQGAADAETGAVVITVTPADADDDAPTVTVDQPSGGTVTQNADGTLTYTPDPDLRAAGAYTDSFTVTANDGHGGVTTTTVTVNVEPPETVDPVQNFFQQLVTAVTKWVGSTSSTISAAWQSFWNWFWALFSQRTDV